MLGLVLSHSCSIFFKARSLNQTNPELANVLPLIASLLYGSPVSTFQGWTYK